MVESVKSEHLLLITTTEISQKLAHLPCRVACYTILNLTKFKITRRPRTVKVI